MYTNDPNQQYYGGQGFPQPGFAPGYAPQGPPQGQPGYGGGYPQGPPGGYPQGPQGGYPQGPPGNYPPPQSAYPPQPGYDMGSAGYGGGYSGENPEPKGFDFSDASIRRGFIRKVYAILMVQLSVSLGFICLCVYHSGTKLFLRNHTELIWVALAVLVVTMISMACCESVRRTSPTNFIFLGLFTLAESFMLGCMTSKVPPDTVLLAVGATAAVCGALTLFAFQTKFDFTVCNGVLFVALILFMIFGIVAMIWPGRTMHLVYASIGALLFSIYLIYDTQLLIGGNHKVSVSPEEYIFAALNIYMDIVNIFIYLLMIISAARDD